MRGRGVVDDNDDGDGSCWTVGGGTRRGRNRPRHPPCSRLIVDTGSFARALITTKKCLWLRFRPVMSTSIMLLACTPTVCQKTQSSPTKGFAVPRYHADASTMQPQNLQDFFEKQKSTAARCRIHTLVRNASASCCSSVSTSSSGRGKPSHVDRPRKRLNTTSVYTAGLLVSPLTAFCSVQHVSTHHDTRR